MSLDPSLNGGLPIVAGTTAVTGLFGGNFIVSAGTSTIATYDPLGGTGAGPCSFWAAIERSPTPRRPTPLAPPSRTPRTGAANSVLNVNGGTAGGGEFDLLRDAGGVVTVGSNAEKINIINGTTVMVGDTSPYGEAYSSNQNSDPGGALYDPVSGNSVNFTGTNGHLVFSRTANITYRGNVSGGVDLTQTGTDTVVLTGSSTYTGKTTITGGTLQLGTGIADTGRLIANTSGVVQNGGLVFDLFGRADGSV